MGIGTLLVKGLSKVAKSSRVGRSVSNTVDDLAEDATVQAIKNNPKTAAVGAADVVLSGVAANKAASNKIKEDKKAIEEAKQTQKKIEDKQKQIDKEREAKEKAKSEANIKAAKEKGPTTVKTTRPHPAAYDQKISTPSGTMYRVPKSAVDYRSDVTDRISKEIDEL